MNCPPPPPPPPPAGEVSAIDGKTIAMPAHLASWYAERSAHADMLHACYLLQVATTSRVTLALEDETATADHWRKVAKSRLTWGWVAAGAVTGAVATGLVVWQVR